MQLASPDDQALGKIGKDSPVPSFVGIGQGGSPDGGTIAHVVQPGRLGEEAGLDIVQAFPIGQLSEREDAEMFGRGKRPDTMVSTIATDDTGEGGPGQVIHQLGEQHFAGVHAGVSRKSVLDDYMKKAGDRSSRHHPKSANCLLISCSYGHSCLS